MSEYAAITWCEWCRADSGRSNATAPCCIARRVSKMPAVPRMRALSYTLERDGVQAGAELRTAVLRSMAMRLAKMAKAERLAAYTRAMRDGWLAPDIDRLKGMAKEEFEQGLIHG